MDSTNIIQWENLVNIPFNACQVKRDNEKQNINIYHGGRLVLYDYDHVGHYMQTALLLFGTIRNKRAQWVNLRSLWTLRDCIRENVGHGIGVDNLIYGENFDGENLETVTPLTKARLELIKKTILEIDPYATV